MGPKGYRSLCRDSLVFQVSSRAPARLPPRPGGARVLRCWSHQRAASAEAPSLGSPSLVVGPSTACDLPLRILGDQPPFMACCLVGEVEAVYLGGTLAVRIILYT